MKKIFVLLFLVVSLVGFIPHKYYVSVVEANQNNDSKKMEISIKFIGHDLEYVLEKENTKELFLGTQKELPNADSLLFSYINTHFNLIINENKQQLSFFGKEVKSNDDIICYLESTPTEEIKSIAIQSDLLIEYFQEHVTIVYITIGEQRFNFRLNTEKQSEKHTITN